MLFSYGIKPECLGNVHGVSGKVFLYVFLFFLSFGLAVCLSFCIYFILCLFLSFCLSIFLYFFSFSLSLSLSVLGVPQNSISLSRIIPDLPGCPTSRARDLGVRVGLRVLRR